MEIMNEEEQVKGIFKDMAKYAPSKIVGFIGNALIVPVYTNILLPEQYGLYSISIAFLSFFCIIFSDWVGLSGLRFFRHHQIADSISKYMTTLISMLSMNIMLMFILAYLFKSQICSFFHIPLRYVMAILLLIIPVAIRAYQGSVKVNVFYFVNNNKSVFDNRTFGIFCQIL